MSYLKSPLLIIFSRMDVLKEQKKVLENERQNSLKTPWKKVCHDLWEPCFLKVQYALTLTFKVIFFAYLGTTIFRNCLFTSSSYTLSMLTGWVCEADGSAEGFLWGRETRAPGAGATPAWGARGDVSGAEPGVVCSQENRGPQSHHQRTTERQATGTYYLNHTINALQKDKLLVDTRIGNLGWNYMIHTSK